MNQHLLIFGSLMVVAWALGTLLLVYFWPHLVNNLYKRAILHQGFGEGPIPVNTLYTEPQPFFANPLQVPASGSNLMKTGVNRDTLLTVGWLDLSIGPQAVWRLIGARAFGGASLWKWRDFPPLSNKSYHVIGCSIHT